MMPKWMGTMAGGKEAATPGDEELRMIPRWSMVLAVVLFAGMQYVFHVVMPHHKHELLPLRLMMGYAWGSLFASYALLLGYVSCDVKRRGMSAGLVDAGVRGAAGRDWRGGVLPAAAAGAVEVPELLDDAGGELPLLPAVPVPDGSGVRGVPSRGEAYGCVLHVLRT